MSRLASLPALAAVATCLVPSVAIQAQSANRSSAEAAAQNGPKADDPATLPGSLVPVPGGRFDIGIEPDELLEIEGALFRTPDQQIRDMTRLFGELGKRKNVEVKPFLMARHPVTNGEYKAFVEATGHRFPYHWWKDAHPDSYNETLPKAREKFPDSKDPAGAYWEQYWKELPYSIPKDGSTPMDEYPVVYVSWEDAVAYAAWVGMRLPTETEWEFAARGTENKQFLWGDDPNGHGLQRGGRFDKLFEVGHHGPKTAGAFGHEDMVLGVWEWTGELGFRPFVEVDDWRDALNKLLRNKMLRDKTNRQVQKAHSYLTKWSGDSVVCKGGMFASQKSELRISIRAPLESIQTVGAIGFRLAKSQRPGFDMLDSAIKVDYDWSYFGGDIRPNLQDQVGIERYDLDGPKQERIAGYHAVSFAPVSHASDDKRIKLAKLVERTVEENRPIVLGTLAVTGKLAQPEIEAGTYTLLYRANGAPRQLDRAVSEAKKAIKQAERAKEEADPTGEFTKTLKKYNITLEDVKAGKIDFVRLNPGAMQVPMKQHSFLLRDKEGNYVAQWKTKGSLEAKSRYENGDATIAVTTDKDGNESITLDFGVPQHATARGKVFSTTVELQLPEDWAGGETWIKPATEEDSKR